MQIQLDDANKSWSSRGLRLAIYATIASVFFALADGIFHGPLSYRYAGADISHTLLLSMFGTWSYDLRIVSDQLMFAGIVLFIGAKFFETRTIFTVGFDKGRLREDQHEGARRRQRRMDRPQIRDPGSKPKASPR